MVKVKKQTLSIKLSKKNEELFRKLIMDDKDCISLWQARAEVEKRWPRTKK